MPEQIIKPLKSEEKIINKKKVRLISDEQNLILTKIKNKKQTYKQDKEVKKNVEKTLEEINEKKITMIGDTSDYIVHYPNGKQYNTKVIKTGNFVERYDYEISQTRDRQLTTRELVARENSKAEREKYKYERLKEIENMQEGAEKENAIKEFQTEEWIRKSINKKKNGMRAKIKLKRLIRANCYQYGSENGQLIYPKFLTFTFADNITDLTVANREWTNFIKRLKRRLGYNPMYVAVVEFQERGAVHYHALFFNIGYRSVEEWWAPIWRNDGRKDKIKKGWIKINAVFEQGKMMSNRSMSGKEGEKVPLNDLGGYLTKYMVKDFADNRLEGKRAYFASVGLKQPQVIIKKWGETEDDFTKRVKEKTGLNGNSKPVYVHQYGDEMKILDKRTNELITKPKNEYTGIVKYKIYNVNV